MKQSIGERLAFPATKASVAPRKSHGFHFVVTLATSAALTVGFFGAGATPVAAASSVIYSSIPSPLPGNSPSYGAQPAHFNELGDKIAFDRSRGSNGTNTARLLDTVVVTLSSHACQSSPTPGGCFTTPGSTFSEPVTFNIYNAGPSNAVGSLIATKTTTFAIPFRPSRDDVNCTGSNAGGWFDPASNSCFTGLDVNITFDFTAQHVTLPETVIYGISYNTETFGYNPIGSAPCDSSQAGCPYNSLNVALADTPPRVGMDVDPTTLYQNSPSLGSAYYCDGGVGGTGTFRLDSAPPNNCWAPYTPSVQFNASCSGPHTSRNPPCAVRP